MKQDIFASTQIIRLNPILNEPSKVKAQYFAYLCQLIYYLGLEKRQFTKAQIAFYKKHLCEENETVQLLKPTFDPSYCFLIPFDLSVMLAFHQKTINTDKSEAIINIIAADFKLSNEAGAILKDGFKASMGDENAWENILNYKPIMRFNEYLNNVKRNAIFLQTKSFNLLITATMSAGKSTLVNALVGKNISLPNRVNANNSHVPVIVFGLTVTFLLDKSSE